MYGYPWEAAAGIAVGTVRRTLEELPRIERVRFVLFSDELLAVFLAALAAERDRL